VSHRPPVAARVPGEWDIGDGNAGDPGLAGSGDPDARAASGRRRRGHTSRAARPPTALWRRRTAARPAPPPPAPPRGSVTRLRPRRRPAPGPYRSVQLRRARPKPVPPLLFGSTAAWATQMLFPTYRREVLRAGFTWCPRWWAHAEAVGRLEALWRAWEHHRQLPAMGMATWWKDYADPTMAALFSPTGPFAACTPTRHHDRDPVPPLPQEPPPTALFPDIRVRPEPEMWRHRHGRR